MSHEGPISWKWGIDYTHYLSPPKLLYTFFTIPTFDREKFSGYNFQIGLVLKHGMLVLWSNTLIYLPMTFWPIFDQFSTTPTFYWLKLLIKINYMRMRFQYREHTCQYALLSGERSPEPSFTPSLADHIYLWEEHFQIIPNICQNIPKYSKLYQKCTLNCPLITKIYF